MKIGLVSPYDWSYPGGVREHIQHLSEQFIAKGHDVRILAPASGRKDIIPEERGYNMGHTIPLPFNGSIVRLSFDPTLVQRAYRVLERERFDVLHVHEPLLPGLSLATLHCSRALTVGTFHAFAHTDSLSVPYLAYNSASLLLRRYFRRLAGRIVVSRAAQQFVSHFFPADYRLIPNGVDLQHFNPRVAPLPHLMDGKQNILFVGRFEQRKGAKYLLQAIPAIRESHPNTRFLLVGDGHLKHNLQEFVERQRWHDVIFTGYIGTEDLPHYFASAHIFCAPATGGESMGIVLLEAMASGTPIVATTIDGYTTVVTSGVDGLLTKPRQSQELAYAVGQLLDYEPLRQHFIQKGLQTVREYDWPQVARRILDYYAQLFDLYNITILSPATGK